MFGSPNHSNTFFVAASSILYSSANARNVQCYWRSASNTSEEKHRFEINIFRSVLLDHPLHELHVKIITLV
jgi:hypothetical protein